MSRLAVSLQAKTATRHRQRVRARLRVTCKYTHGLRVDQVTSWMSESALATWRRTDLQVPATPSFLPSTDLQVAARARFHTGQRLRRRREPRFYTCCRTWMKARASFLHLPPTSTKARGSFLHLPPDLDEGARFVFTPATGLHLNGRDPW